MVDIKLIQEQTEVYKQAAKDKNIAINIDELLAIEEEKKQLLVELEELRAERNANAESMKKAGGKPDQAAIEQGKKLKEQIAALEAKYRPIKEKYHTLMLMVPTVPAPDAPVGSDESGNVEIKKQGALPEFGFEPKDHMVLAKELDLIDLERGVKVVGFRGYYLKNESVMLQMGLMIYALNKMISKGFTPFITPTIVREIALVGSGHFPFGKEEVFQIANPGKTETGEDVKEAKYLVGTAEPSLLAYRADEVLDSAELPLKMCGFSNCYRSEVGSYGKDYQGVYRVFEFMKVEQVVLCQPDLKSSMKILNQLLIIAEEMLMDLQLPYRVIEVCTGDMGAGKYKMYDVETWMPSRDNYCETHSCSHLLDWQTRRLNIKVKDVKGNKVYPYALNNTVIASPRILIAILENYQQADGSIKVPDILVPYVGKKLIRAKGEDKKK